MLFIANEDISMHSPIISINASQCFSSFTERPELLRQFDQMENKIEKVNLSRIDYFFKILSNILSLFIFKMSIITHYEKPIL